MTGTSAITRRGFVIGAGALSLTLAGVLDAARRAADALAALPQPALAPDDPAVRATMTAFADTIVPGPAGKADPAPGAVEAGCVDELYDPFYSLSPSFPVLHDDLAVATPRILGRVAAFDLDLPYPDRERVLLDRMTAEGSGGQSQFALLYQGAAIVVYIAYYGTARSNLGVRYIGFPPHSNGYFPDSSYGVSFSSMTDSGNPD